jgi:hypothetical protein
MKSFRDIRDAALVELADAAVAGLSGLADAAAALANGDGMRQSVRTLVVSARRQWRVIRLARRPWRAGL